MSRAKAPAILAVQSKMSSQVKKQIIREKIWNLLQTKGAARFPGAHGRIPNFVGAERCADHLEKLSVWTRAKVIKTNPDSPQRAIRYAALRQGKILYMAVPRLKQLKYFIELDPKKIGEKRFWEASSISGAARCGCPVGVEEMMSVDLIVCGEGITLCGVD